MRDPLICCIMPTRDRHEMALRAVRCVDDQTYEDNVLVLVDTGKNPLPKLEIGGLVIQYSAFGLMKSTIGVLRNEAIHTAVTGLKRCDYIAHFDDDDISAPLRLQRQLEHIQKTGKLVTGFYDMPMYDVKHDKVWIYTNPHKERYSLGNCLFYKLEAWERVKFPDMTPEDNLWRKNIGGENIESRSVFEEDGTPLMIQVIHGANASASIIRSSAYYKEPSESQEKAIRELLASA